MVHAIMILYTACIINRVALVSLPLHNEFSQHPEHVRHRITVEMRLRYVSQPIPILLLRCVLLRLLSQRVSRGWGSCRSIVERPLFDPGFGLARLGEGRMGECGKVGSIGVQPAFEWQLRDI
jgi:hypothetical protein